MSYAAKHRSASKGAAGENARISPGKTSLSSQLQRRSPSRDGADPDDAVSRAAASDGGPLPPELQERFETSLGTDLSSVRVHDGPASAEAADAIGARAYATGNDIHFGEGHYDPGSSEGALLIAHEVAHTVQQRGAAPVRQHKLAVSSAGDTAEADADHAAAAMVAGAPARVGAQPVGTLYRGEEGQDCDPEEPRLADFVPSVSVTPSKLTVDAFDQGSVSARFTNEKEMPPGTDWSMAWKGEVDEKIATPVASDDGSLSVTGVAAGTTGDTIVWSGATAEETKAVDAGKVTIVVPKPTITEVESDTGGIFMPKEEARVVIEVGHLKDPEINSGLSYTMDCGGSAKDLKVPGAEAFNEAWSVTSATWNGSRLEFLLRANHAGQGTLTISSSVAGVDLEHVVMVECAHNLETFKARLDDASRVASMIEAHAMALFSDMNINLKAAFENHKGTLAADDKARKTGPVPGMIWDIIKGAVEKDPRGKAVTTAIDIAMKLAGDEGSTKTAASLQAVSSSLPGFTGHITAHQGAGGAAVNENNLVEIATKALAGIKGVCAGAVQQWDEWASSAASDSMVTFDPADALLQSAEIAGTPLLALPGSPSVDEYERSVWVYWVETSAISYPATPLPNVTDHRLVGGVNRNFDDDGPVAKRLLQLGVPFPSVVNGQVVPAEVVHEPGPSKPGDGGGGAPPQ
jgi:hypothetical protein